MPTNPKSLTDVAFASGSAGQLAFKGPNGLPATTTYQTVTGANLTLTGTVNTPEYPLVVYRSSASGGNKTATFFGSQAIGDPDSYVSDDGAWYTGVELVVSSASVGTGTNDFRYVQPTINTDNLSIGIWSDFSKGASMVVRDSGLTGTRSYEILSNGGAYRFSVDPDGKHWWGNTTAQDGVGHPNYTTTGTNLYCGGLNLLKTDGVFAAGSDLQTGGNLQLNGSFGNIQLGNGSQQFLQLATTGIEILTTSSWLLRCPTWEVTNVSTSVTFIQTDGTYNYLFLPTLVGSNSPGSVGAKLEAKAANGSQSSFAAYDSSGNPTLNVAPTGVAIGGGVICKKEVSATAALDFPSISAGALAELTLTVTGAVVGGSVSLGPPSGLEAGLMCSGRVSAADTVAIRVANNTAGAIDPASATWRATVRNY